MKRMRILRSCSGSLSAISIIKEFIDNGCFVVCADKNPLSSGLFLDRDERFKNKVIGVVVDTTNIVSLSEAIDKNNVDWFIPSIEEEFNSFKYVRGLFSPLGKTYNLFRDKFVSNSSFIKAGLGTPETHEGLLDIDFNKECLWVIRPKQGRGSSGVKVVSTGELRHLNFQGCVISKCLSGQEFSVDVLCGLDGSYICSGMRYRTSVESGICVKSQMFYDKNIENDIKRLCSAYEFSGVFNVQGIIIKNKRFYFDLNFRFGGGSILSIKAGVPLVSGLISVLKGDAVNIGKINTNLSMLRYYSEIFIS